MVLSFCAYAQEEMNDLQTYRWKNRIILLFAPSPDHSYLQEQRLRLEAETDGLTERDLLVFDVYSEKTEKEQALKLHRRFQVAANSFAVVLIGKDGTEKLRQYAPVTPEKIFAVIDAMPMRQQEMRSQR